MKEVEAISKFADYLANVKNYSSNTVISYRNDIEEFMNFVVSAVLLILISNIGLGLLVFLIISIVSAILKLVRIYARHK